MKGLFTYMDTQNTPPVAISAKKKAKRSPWEHKASPFIWGFQEELTEAEGQALETFRKWRRAENDPAYRAELHALDLLIMGLYEARDGGERWAEFAREPGLTTAEVAAFEIVVNWWKQDTRRNKQSAKYRKKQKRKAARKEGAS